MNSFGEKEAWAYPGTAQFFWVHPIISGTGKAKDIKFGQCIQRVHPNKIPLKISEKRERGRIQGLPNFLGTPYYLRNGKSYGFQIWPEEYKPMKILEKRKRRHIQGLPKFWGGIPYYLRNGKSYGFQIWPVHSEGPSE